MPATTAGSRSLATITVSVTPLILLSAVDHYDRSAKGTRKRVVGVLLGQNEGKNVRISNSFAVPFEEDKKNPSVWFLDHNYVESMNDLFKKLNAKERLIGWYHSGPKLRASDLEVNELFKRYTPNPLLVIIDVQPKEGRGFYVVASNVTSHCPVQQKILYNKYQTQHFRVLNNNRNSPSSPKLNFERVFVFFWTLQTS
ncbi:hypothetical protein VE03_10624 [Pseudogymnoascus sp. 23342-1-I1]|nr:hypothetical protein VE03_10624 [Pseudogymnoascus sp. 23342-1-I1]